jgi:hypothetical protein
MGGAPYQFVYSGAGWSPLDIASGFRWVTVSLALALVLAVWARQWCWVPGLGLGVTCGVAAVRSAQAPLPRRWRGLRARWLLFVLFLVQPVVRGGARWWTARWQRARPAGPAGLSALRSWIRWRWWLPGGQRAFWSESGQGRLALVEGVASSVAGARPSPDQRFDLTDRAGAAALQSVSEFHGAGRCLTRVRWWAGLRPLGVALAAGAGAALVAWAYPGAGMPILAAGAVAGAGVRVAAALAAAGWRWRTACLDAAARAGMERVPR